MSNSNHDNREDIIKTITPSTAEKQEQEAQKKEITSHKQESRHKWIPLLTAIVTLLTAIVGFMAKIPWPAEKSAANSSNTQESSVPSSNPSKKIESIMKETVDQYFDDTALNVYELNNGKEYIKIYVYTFNDNRVNSKKAIEMAEAIFAILTKEKQKISAVDFVYLSATGTATVANAGELLIPSVIWSLIQTKSTKGDDIWVSALLEANREYFQNADIFRYEYEQSKVFRPIDVSNIDYDHEKWNEEINRTNSLMSTIKLIQTY